MADIDTGSWIRIIIGGVSGAIFLIGSIIFGIYYCTVIKKRRAAARLEPRATAPAMVTGPGYYPTQTNSNYTQQYSGGPAPPPYPAQSSQYGPTPQQPYPGQQKGDMSYGNPPPDYS